MGSRWPGTPHTGAPEGCLLGGQWPGGTERPLTPPGSSLPPPALADFDEPKRSTFVMFGVLTIAVRVYHDRWGYGVPPFPTQF